MKCSICKKNIAIYYQKHSGLYFCKDCFIKHIAKKVRKNLGKDILKQGVKVGIGLSGGKDSLVMAHFLNEFYKPIPNSNIVAIIVDEGISGYRDEGIDYAVEFCRKNDIPYVITSFKKHIGYTLDEMIKIAKNKKLSMNPCSFCGVIRRKILNNIARNERCNYLAIGHNLDDMAQAIFMNYIEGDIKKLAILGNNANNSLFVKRIKPLRTIPEDEIILLADLINLKYHKSPCPYSSISYRAEISDILDKLEKNHPGIKYSIVSGHTKLLKYLPSEKNMKTCKYCNEPSASEVCKVCMFLKKLGLNIN
jgi:uncharacterized protein (TIGR00269 family)